MTRSLLLAMVGLAAGLLAWGQAAPAAKPADPPPPPPPYTISTALSGAQLNWLTGQLEAVGIGYLRDRSRMANRQARTTALAIMSREARRVLLTLPVDAGTTLADVTKDPQAQRALDELVSNLTIVEERVANGGYIVVGVLPLYGEKGVTYLGSKKLSTTQPVEAKPEELSLLPQIPRGHTTQHCTAPYTGVIIDADSVVLNPCLFPRVLRFDGKELWGIALPNPMSPVAMINGPVRYAPNLPTALQAKLAGERPLVLQAVGVGKGCYPAVNLDDVYLVLNEQKYHGVLNNLPVIITMGVK